MNLPWPEDSTILSEPIRYKLASTIAMYLLLVNKKKRKTSKRKILSTKFLARHEKPSV